MCAAGWHGYTNGPGTWSQNLSHIKCKRARLPRWQTRLCKTIQCGSAWRPETARTRPEVSNKKSETLSNLNYIIHWYSGRPLRTQYCYLTCRTVLHALMRRLHASWIYLILLSCCAIQHCCEILKPCLKKTFCAFLCSSTKKKKKKSCFCNYSLPLVSRHSGLTDFRQSLA